MEWESNIFYYPEKHGLTTVACISYDTSSYQFDYKERIAQGRDKV